MTSFSFTAPFITEEEEKAERAALSEAERETIRRDLYGEHEDNADEPETSAERALELFHEALQAIPTEKKQAYMQAIERVSDLVEKETNPLLFLQGMNFDAWAAAEKMTQYWQQRLALFGADHAFLPMTCAGAMQPHLQHLEKGVIRILPNDEHGRSVMFMDRIRAIRSIISREGYGLVGFYTLHLLMHQTVKQGYVAMVNVRLMDLYKHFDRIQTKMLLTISRAFPMHARAIHICAGSGASVVNLILPVVKVMMGRDIRLRSLLHAGPDSEVLARVRQYGLTKEQVQYLSKGSQHEEEMRVWIREQQAREEVVDEVQT